MLTNGIEVENGMLSFANYAHFRTVLEGLIDAQEQHLTNFENSYPDLSNEELDTKEEEIDFVYFKPLIKFEKALDFNSRRSKIEDDIIVWLDNEILDFETYPGAEDGHSPEFRTLMNNQGKVLIGGEEENLLLQRRPNDCWHFNKKVDDEEYDMEKELMYEVLLEQDSWPWLHKLHAEVTHFRRKNNGKWKRSRANLSINVTENVYDEECRAAPESVPFKSKRKRRKSLDVRTHIWGPSSWLTGKDNEVTSNFSVNGNSRFIVLN